ncbi:uncharacterized protein LOC113359649 [Papaver somniferum]|uniref:uncharacterized protein LOC113359649 n=1 Tax=Papaver somniferum TaxID=3469 RepID=UPI000E703FCE|nr:uncharacterized protein LOC113359649 [Papaver somniferum]
MPPRKTQLKLNIDAAWISVNLPAGFSLILRNDARGFEQGRAGSFTTATPEEAEALGMLQGAKWALEKEWSNFSVKGDCKNLVDYLNGKPTQMEWRNQAIIDEVKCEFNKCTNFLVFFYIPRLANQAADTLTKEAKTFGKFVTWVKYPPTCILQNLEVDKSNAKDKQHHSASENSINEDVRVPNSPS